MANFLFILILLSIFGIAHSIYDWGTLARWKKPSFTYHLMQLTYSTTWLEQTTRVFCLSVPVQQDIFRFYKLSHYFFPEWYWFLYFFYDWNDSFVLILQFSFLLFSMSISLIFLELKFSFLCPAFTRELWLIVFLVWNLIAKFLTLQLELFQWF